MYITQLFTRQIDLQQFSVGVKVFFTVKDLYVAYVKCVSKLYKMGKPSRELS